MMSLLHLDKSYQVGGQRQAVLTDVSLDLQPGEFTALMGPSGSGKTTLLNLCGLIDRPDRGQIIWQGQDVTEASAGALNEIRRQEIGFIFQGFNLIPVMSAWDNVAYPFMLTNTDRATVKAQVDAVLHAVGLAEFARKLPGELSGGQRQRVAIARALVKHPALIVADEPTASLDEDTALNVVDLLKSLSLTYQTTVVVATHDPRLLPFCDRVCRLSHGQVAEAHTTQMEGIV
ncbi:MAG: ABC transporter ATP-binding protein [Natronospirillum sp.]